MWLAFVAPQVFVDEEEADNARLNAASGSSDSRVGVYKVRAGIVGALLWGGFAMTVGSAIGATLGLMVGPVLKAAIIIVVVGTTILMWASLALQGWNIQTFSGATLSERLNQWIFRTLYFIGTLLISAGSVWSLF